MICRSAFKRLLGFSNISTSPLLLRSISEIRQQHSQAVKSGRLDGNVGGLPSPFLINRASSSSFLELVSRNIPNAGVPSPISDRVRVKITVPEIHRIHPIIFETPPSGIYHDTMEDPGTKPEINDESPSGQIEKQAARLIVIRRIKMNKHKLRKLRKRMKYVWAKRDLRRAIRKEKAFLNMSMAKIREAQKFDAKAYVADILQRAKYEPLPTRWKGEWLPEPLIREKLEMAEKQKKQAYLSILDKRSKKQ